MAAALGSLIVTLGLDAVQYVVGLTKAEHQAKRWKAETLKAARDVGMLLGAAGAAAATGLAAMTKKAIDGADALSKLSGRTGIAVEALSALQFAGKLNDVGADTMAKGLKTLAESAVDAANGVKAPAEAFKALGIEVTDATGKLRGTDAILSDLAKKFQGYADGPEKVALATQLLGRAGVEMIPLLNQGADGLANMADEAKRLGIIVDTETAKAAEVFNDTLTVIGTQAEATGLALARELLPALQAVADEFANAARGEGPFAGALDLLTTAARVATEVLVILGANVAFVFKGIGREIGAVAAQMVALAKLDFSGFRAISDAVRDDARRARAELDAFERRVLGSAALPQASYSNEGRNRTAAPAARPPAPRLSGGGGARAAASGRSGSDEAERYLAGLQRQIDGLRDVSAEEQALKDIQAGRLKSVAPRLQQEIILLAQRLDQGRKAKDLAEEEARSREAVAAASSRSFALLADESDALRASNQALAEDIALTAGGIDARHGLEMARLASAIALKEDTLAAYENAGATEAELVLLRQQIDLLRERAGLLETQRTIEKQGAEETKKATSAAEELGMTFASAFEDAIVEGKKLSDVIKSLEKDIVRLVTRELVTKPLADSITGFAKGLMEPKGKSGESGGGIFDFVKGMMGGGSGGGQSGGSIFDFFKGLMGSGSGGGGGWLSSITSLISGLFGGGRAVGGMAAAGKIYRVNEHRPELLDVNGKQFLMMGNRSGMIHAGGTSTSRSTSISAPITVMMPQGTSHQSATQVGNMLALRLRRANLRNA